MILAINQVPIASGTLDFPWVGSWRLEARIDDDPSIQVGQPFTITADNAPTLSGELQRVTRFGSLAIGQARTRILGVPTGTSQLSRPLVPQNFSLMTRQQIMLALFPALTFAAPDAQGAEVLTNFPVTSTMTGQKLLNFFYPNYYWDENSLLHTIERVPNFNQGDFIQTDAGFSDMISLAVQSQFLLMPGDIWLDNSIVSCMYQLENSPRILARVQL